ncbi:hypothetical protein C2U69_30715 [Cupriavidus pinatubonensis]|nr:hypothetical protein C2U69_30715 [Cupriavidus pinatubonensis]
MIDVAILSIIRRWHLRDHLPLREIARRHGLVIHGAAERRGYDRSPGHYCRSAWVRRTAETGRLRPSVADRG